MSDGVRRGSETSDPRDPKASDDARENVFETGVVGDAAATKPRRSRDSASPRTASRSVSAARGRREGGRRAGDGARLPRRRSPRRAAGDPARRRRRRPDGGGGDARARARGDLVGLGLGLGIPIPPRGRGAVASVPRDLGGVRGTFIIPEYRRNPGGGRGVPAGRRLGGERERERAGGAVDRGGDDGARDGPGRRPDRRTLRRGRLGRGGERGGGVDFFSFGRARGVRGRVRRGADVEARRGGARRGDRGDARRRDVQVLGRVSRRRGRLTRVGREGRGRVRAVTPRLRRGRARARAVRRRGRRKGLPPPSFLIPNVLFTSRPNLPMFRLARRGNRRARPPPATDSARRRSTAAGAVRKRARASAQRCIAGRRARRRYRAGEARRAA